MAVENLQQQKLAINNLEKEMKKEMANMMQKFLTKKLPEIIEKLLQSYFSKFNSKIDQINDDITHLRYRTDELTGNLAYINNNFESASASAQSYKTAK